jgi:hypothetical protein
MASVCLAVGSAWSRTRVWIATFPKFRGTPEFRAQHRCDACVGTASFVAGDRPRAVSGSFDWPNHQERPRLTYHRPRPCLRRRWQRNCSRSRLQSEGAACPMIASVTPAPSSTSTPRPNRQQCSKTRALWATIAASYRYLHEREERLEAEDRQRAGTANEGEPPELSTPRSASRNP